MPVDRTSIGYSSGQLCKQASEEIVDSPLIPIMNPRGRWEWVDPPEIKSDRKRPEPVTVRIYPGTESSASPETMAAINELARKMFAKWLGNQPTSPTPARPALTPDQQRVAETIARANAQVRYDPGIRSAFRRGDR